MPFSHRLTLTRTLLKHVAVHLKVPPKAQIAFRELYHALFGAGGNTNQGNFKFRFCPNSACHLGFTSKLFRGIEVSFIQIKDWHFEQE